MVEVYYERTDGRGDDEGARYDGEQADCVEKQPALEERWKNHLRRYAVWFRCVVKLLRDLVLRR